MSNVYLISDLHVDESGNFYRKFRPQFSSAEESIEHSITCWNSLVRKRDVVKVLGDFIINLKSLPYLKRFNGTIHWILGNHDPKITQHILQEYTNVSYVGGLQKYKGCFLSHAPMHPQELECRNVALNIHGHIHHKERNNLGDKYYNVNVDIMGHFPKLFKEILEERGINGKETTRGSTK